MSRQWTWEEGIKFSMGHGRIVRSDFGLGTYPRVRCLSEKELPKRTHNAFEGSDHVRGVLETVERILRGAALVQLEHAKRQEADFQFIVTDRQVNDSIWYQKTLCKRRDWDAIARELSTILTLGFPDQHRFRFSDFALSSLDPKDIQSTCYLVVEDLAYEHEIAKGDLLRGAKPVRWRRWS